MDERLQQVYDSVINGDMRQSAEHVQAALDAGIDPAVILKDGMIAAMKEVGRLFEEGEYYVPEMLIAARAMKAGVALLKPRLVQAGTLQSAGTVVIGSVKGDLHDIGKNLVAMMLEGAGYEVVDLGTDVSPAAFADAIRAHQPLIVGMSALLTTTMPAMKTTIDTLTSEGLRRQVKVIVGGAPVTDAYAHDITADGYAPDASRAVALANALLGRAADA
jgi:5-methyltetrahydrofolate--homocysteine methyltransferase